MTSYAGMNSIFLLLMMVEIYMIIYLIENVIKNLRFSHGVAVC